MGYYTPTNRDRGSDTTYWIFKKNTVENIYYMPATKTVIMAVSSIFVKYQFSWISLQS